MKKLLTTLLGLAVLSPFALAQEFTVTLFPNSVNESTLTHYYTLLALTPFTQWERKMLQVMLQILAPPQL